MAFTPFVPLFQKGDTVAIQEKMINFCGGIGSDGIYSKGSQFIVKDRYVDRPQLPGVHYGTMVPQSLLDQWDEIKTCYVYVLTDPEDETRVVRCAETNLLLVARGPGEWEPVPKPSFVQTSPKEAEKPALKTRPKPNGKVAPVSREDDDETETETELAPKTNRFSGKLPQKPANFSKGGAFVLKLRSTNQT